LFVGVLAERLRGAAESVGVSVEGLLLEAALARVDPLERAGAYAEAARELLAAARDGLARGDLRQAGERIWGLSRGELWRFASRVAGEFVAGFTMRGMLLMPCT